MASDDDWDCTFTDPAEREYERLQPHEQERIVSKLDEIVTDRWREPRDYLKPLTGAPRSKLRIGAFRLGCKTDHTEQVLWVYTIEKRPGPTNRATTDFFLPRVNTVVALPLFIEAAVSVVFHGQR